MAVCGKDRREKKNGSWRLCQSHGRRPENRERMEGGREESDRGCLEGEKKTRKKGERKKKSRAGPRPTVWSKMEKMGVGEEKRNGEKKIGCPL